MGFPLRLVEAFANPSLGWAMTGVTMPYTAWTMYQTIKQFMELFRVHSAKPR